MTEAILKFDLDDVEDLKNFKVAESGYSLLWAINDIQQMLRQASRKGYGTDGKELTEEQQRFADDIYGKFYTILEDNGVRLGDLS